MPTFSLILLHGLGADGRDMQPIAQTITQAIEQAIKARLRTPSLTMRIHCPDAPARPVTVNGGYVMPAWFDLYSLNADARSDTQGITQSVKRIQTLLNAEHAAGVPWTNIILGGFSQGGVIAMHCALNLPERLGGLLALSSWLPSADGLTPSADARQTPVFIGHGKEDDLIPLSAATRTRDTLTQLGYRNIQQHSYPIPHSVSMEEIDDIAQWLSQQLAH